MLVPVTLGFPAAKHRMSAPENMTTNAKTMDESASSYCSTLSKHVAHLNKFGKNREPRTEASRSVFLSRLTPVW